MGMPWAELAGALLGRTEPFTGWMGLMTRGWGDLRSLCCLWQDPLLFWL